MNEILSAELLYVDRPGRIAFGVVCGLLVLFLFGCGDGGYDGARDAAARHIAAGDFVAARIDLKNALESQPDDKELRTQFGMVLSKLGDVGLAEVEFRKARQLGVQPEVILPQLAAVLLDLGKYDEVLSLVEQAGGLSPQAGSAMHALAADAFLALGKTKEAEAAIQRARELDGDGARAHLGMARLAVIGRDYASAMSEASRAIAMDQSLSAAWFFKAQVHLKEKQLDQAVDSLDKAIAQRPGFLPAYALLGELLVERGDVAGAESRIAALRRISPSAPLVHYLHALTARAKGDLSKARESARLAMKVLPDDPQATSLMATIEFELGNISAAERFLAKAVLEFPENEALRKRFASALLQLGRVSDAQKALSPLLVADESDVATLLLAGEIAARQRAGAKALEYFAKAADVAPRDAIAQERFGRALLDTGKTADGLARLERAADLAPGKTQAREIAVDHLLRAGKLDDAQRGAAAFLAGNPKLPQASQLMGAVLSARKDSSGARKKYQEALSLDPAYLPAVRSLARLDIQDRDLSAATERFRTFLQANPLNLQAAQELAGLLEANGAPQVEVLKVLDAAVAASGAAPGPHISKISYLARNGEHKSAIDAAQASLAVFPDHPQLMWLLAQSQEAAGDSGRAVLTYEKLTSVAPKSQLGYLGQAQIYFAQRKVDEARAAAERAKAVNPDSIDPHVALVEMDTRLGERERALAGAREIQKRWPDQVAGYGAEARVLSGSKDFAAAEAVVHRGIVATRNSTLVKGLLLLLDRQGKTGDAEKAASDWLRSAPQDASVMATMGELRLRVGDYARARDWFKRALEAQPDDPSALNNLAWCLLRTNDRQALVVADRLVSLYPRNAAFLDTAGMVHSEFGNVDVALRHLREATGLVPGSAPFGFNLAKALVKAGRKSEARGEFDRVLNLSMDSRLKEQIEAYARSLP
jgi:putative PEP-CTERM system TPR-repeat lipoprotein